MGNVLTRGDNFSQSTPRQIHKIKAKGAKIFLLGRKNKGTAVRGPRRVINDVICGEHSLPTPGEKQGLFWLPFSSYHKEKGEQHV